MNDSFSVYHPIINFVFFIGAFVFGMLLMHPVFLLCSVGMSLLYYLTVRGVRGLRFTYLLLGLFLILSLLNPLFSPYGNQVLFTYLGGRVYTLDALYYGMALAAMMVSVLSWFASYQAVMTSDKFLYLFGRLAPSVTLILTMVLRLVPIYRKKISQVNGARRGIGLTADVGSRKEKAEHAMVLISALTSWALEGGIITADSMRSRGYGCGKRTSFSFYRFEGRDRILLGMMGVFITVIAVCALKGGTGAVYLPQLRTEGAENPYFIAGLLAYGGFLAIPSAVNILEEIRWHNLRSKI